MESESDQLDCLDVPVVTDQFLLPVVVLRKILENLSNADLLNLSLVNREWNYEARSVLWGRGNLTAKMNTAGGSCKDLRAFASYLRQIGEVTNVNPFSGLTIIIWGAYAYHGDWCEELSRGEMDQVCEDILHQMQCKRLTLDLSDYWDRKQYCAGFKLIKKVLHNCSLILEEFSLKIASNYEDFIELCLLDCNFSRLRTLKFHSRRSDEDEDLIKALVSRSPNLKDLHTKGCVNLNANLLEGSAAVHVTDYPYLLSLYDDNEIPERIVGQLRLRQLWLGSDSQDCNLDRFNAIVPKFLETSRTTLSSMIVKAMYLVPLMHYGICLDNVRELIVTLSDSDFSQPRSRRLLRTFDFNRVFPNLSSVQVQINCCYMHNSPNFLRVWNAVIDMVEQENSTLIEPVNRSENIKELCLDWHPGIPDFCTRFLVEMFPNIKKLFVQSRGLFFRLWDYWLDLKELDVTVRFISDVHGNLDSAFCGIFPQEVADLREQDDDYLRCVNIVPVMPSLSCLKGLTTFRIFFDDDDGVSSIGDPASLLSEVSGLIAFRRRPDLTVTLATNSDRWTRELQHMEPYASVRLTIDS